MLGTLRAIAEGMPGAFLDDLVVAFLHDTEVRLVELEAAVDAGDAETVARLGHFLKSSCASMGAVRLGAVLATVERHALAAELVAVRPLLASLGPELARVRAALELEIAVPASR